MPKNTIVLASIRICRYFPESVKSFPATKVIIGVASISAPPSIGNAVSAKKSIACWRSSWSFAVWFCFQLLTISGIRSPMNIVGITLITSRTLYAAP